MSTTHGVTRNTNRDTNRNTARNTNRNTARNTNRDTNRNTARNANRRLDFRFAIASDLHIGLPHTIWNHPSRFHLIEVSIAAFEQVLAHVSQLDIDFLLLPGDLVQHGERENHLWLRDRLAQLPFPVYVIPGNHDFVTPQGDETRIDPTEFPQIYDKFGYADGAPGQCDSGQCDYSVSPLPGLRLIGLNSNQFDREGRIVGRLRRAQFDWLEQQLVRAQSERANERVFVMIHHNVIEHMPQQAKHPLGYKYILRNASRLRSLLKQYGVSALFTGHLHIQDVARDGDLYEITTGSLVSYPHPYRVLQFQEADGVAQLSYESFRVQSVAPETTTALAPSDSAIAALDVADLQEASRQWMGDRSQPFMENLLTAPPVSLARSTAVALAPSLREFWADIANGDRTFDFPQLPDPIKPYFESFGALEGPIDNSGHLVWD